MFFMVKTGQIQQAHTAQNYGSKENTQNQAPFPFQTKQGVLPSKANSKISFSPSHQHKTGLRNAGISAMKSHNAFHSHLPQGCHNRSRYKPMFSAASNIL